MFPSRNQAKITPVITAFFSSLMRNGPFSIGPALVNIDWTVWGENGPVSKRYVVILSYISYCSINSNISLQIGDTDESYCETDEFKEHQPHALFGNWASKVLFKGSLKSTNDHYQIDISILCRPYCCGNCEGCSRSTQQSQPSIQRRWVELQRIFNIVRSRSRQCSC